MEETQHTIALWADATFGPVRSDASHVARAMKEMAELADDLANDPTNVAIIEEAADVVICLTRLAEKLGIDTLSSARFRCLDGRAVVTMDPVDAFIEANRSFARLYKEVNDEESFREDVSSALITTVAWLNWMSYCLGKDLLHAVKEKMAVNRRRQWRRDGNGHGYHLKPGESAALGAWETQARRAEFGQELDRDP